MEIQLTLTEQEVSFVVQGLAELPAKLTFNIITKIQNQYLDQTKNSKEADTNVKQETND